VKPDERKVRIVVRKTHSQLAPHGGSWKVAYADLVTTMMALFIVLWLIGENAAIKEGIADYFKNPGVFRQRAASSPLPGGAGVLPAGLSEAELAAARERAEEERALQEAAARIRELIAKGGPFEDLHDQIKIELPPEGLRIEFMEKEGSPFFRVGSAVIIAPLKPLLERVQKILATLPNHITVEGHTDGRPYSGRHDYSNWELSADRANSARRVMEADGLPPGKIDRIVGHADRLLAVPDDPYDAKNRRITLLVRRQRHK
jgi:chemotaxis protein MotB